MNQQLDLLDPSQGRSELWFRAVDLLGRPVADIPVHECVGGWDEAAKWCYLALVGINSAIGFARDIEKAACDAAGIDGSGALTTPCCRDAPFDRHYLAHVAVHLRPI